jgi:hypothetical protein
MTTDTAARAAPRRHSFAHLVDAIGALAENHAVGGGKSVSVGDIMTVVGRRSFGPLLLIVGLFSISPATILPGMTWFAAALSLVLSLQLALGARHPWLPAGLLRICVPRDTLRAATTDGLRKWARRLDLILRPRLVLLSEPPFANGAGLFCAAAAIATFPLGLIPAAPLAPGVAITIIGLGLFARDGVILLIGGAIVGAAIWAAYATVQLF